MLKTKIVCTLGPASNSPEMIEKMIRAGMNVARLNFSHGTHEEHAEVIDRIKKARDRLGVPLAIMLDTKGPEIRLGRFAGG
ncbi:MAG: pyruvate kinase, partial [Clostridia bacterium]|nr:pyruvate kinase [Clostridia bacterium]